MFKAQIEGVKGGINHCQEMGNHYRSQVHKIPIEWVDDYSRSIRFWLNREGLYREALSVLEGLQAKYNEQFPWYKPWRRRNGHNAKLGLGLSAKARLSVLERRAEVKEPTAEEGFG